MSALVFEASAPIAASAPNRADIACFVGYAAVRPGVEMPPALLSWLVEHGWLRGARGAARRALAAAELLRDLPVPIESWSAFDHLFAWERRPHAEGRGFAATYLGAAVRSFFAEGGRRCYVVAVGAPWPLPGAAEGLLSPEALGRQRIERIEALIPGFPGAITAEPTDPASWRGLGHLFGLPDVSFLCLPDLPDALRRRHTPAELEVTLPPLPERFLDCSDGEQVKQDAPARRYHAPRCDEEAYAVWARAVERVRDLLARRQREVQLIAAVPLPEPGAAEERFLPMLLGGRRPGAAGVASSLASSFVQLAYPWVRTGGSRNLPEELASPDGALAGVLARNALTRGTFRSAAGTRLADVYDLSPQLPQEQMRPARAPVARAAGARTLAERVSLLGRTPGGIRLLSDVTASASESYRPASVHRLVSAIARASRRLGEELVFEASGELLWARVRAQLEGLMLALYQEGALRGATPADAFQVRADRSTMRQADLDNGRVIAEVHFEAAAPIERITVVLALDASGELALLAAGRLEVAA